MDLLIFRLAGQRFACPAAQVERIAQMPAAGAHELACGAAADARLAREIMLDTPLSDAAWTLIVTARDGACRIAVSAVERISNVTPRDIHPLPVVLQRWRRLPYVWGVATFAPGELVVLLDLSRFVATNS